MKKIVKALTFIVAPVIALCTVFAGCKSCNGTPVTIPEGENFMRDIDVAPEIEAYYEEQTKQVVAEYKAVANLHLTDDGDVDIENAEVVAAACSAAAKLFAYACYNESQLDRYAYFSTQTATTSVNIGSAVADRQEYYLRVNETEQTCGYRFHRTIKKVKESKGAIDTFKSSFESARIRMTDKTNLLYRFEGNNLRYSGRNDELNCDMLTADWRTGSDWGVADIAMKKGAKLNTLEEIAADIQTKAGEDNVYIRGNINILAENIIKYAVITEDEDDGTINAIVTINTDVANNDDASLKMLRSANDSSNCRWVAGDNYDEEGTADTGYLLVYRIWPNGLFRTYAIIERWSGKINVTSGTADSTTTYYYSYSEHDCDMTAYLAMLEDAKTKR